MLRLGRLRTRIACVALGLALLVMRTAAAQDMARGDARSDGSPPPSAAPAPSALSQPITTADPDPAPPTSRVPATRATSDDDRRFLIVLEYLSGFSAYALLAGSVAGIGSAACRPMLPGAGWNDWCLVGLVIVGAVHAVFLVPAAVSGAGYAMRQTGSYWHSMLGGIIGVGVGSALVVPGIMLMRIGISEALGGVLLTGIGVSLPPIGAAIGYEVSRHGVRPEGPAGGARNGRGAIATWMPTLWFEGPTNRAVFGVGGTF